MMDIERTVQFILDQQAKFTTDLQAVLDAVHQTERTVRSLAEVTKLHSERLSFHRERLDAQERQFKEFLARFDAFLRGRGGNGTESP